MLKTHITGRVIRLDFDDVSTDDICPSQYRLAQPDGDHDLSTLRPHIMEALRPGLDAIVKPGDVVVTGKNFGLGSHREPAVTIFKVWGVQAVVTESAARIWFRNAIAAALPVVELENALSLFAEGDQIEIDLRKGEIRNRTAGGATLNVPPYPPTVFSILEAGGMMQLVRKRLEQESRK